MSKPSEKAMHGAATATQELVNLGLIDENEADVFEQSIMFAFDEALAEHQRVLEIAEKALKRIIHRDLQTDSHTIGAVREIAEQTIEEIAKLRKD